MPSAVADRALAPAPALDTASASATAPASASAPAPGHACWMCGRRAASHQLNVRHMMTHLRSYRCMQCGRPFTREEDLFRHIDEQHQAEAGEAAEGEDGVVDVVGDASGEEEAGAKSVRRQKYKGRPKSKKDPKMIELVDLTESCEGQGVCPQGDPASGEADTDELDVVGRAADEDGSSDDTLPSSATPEDAPAAQRRVEQTPPQVNGGSTWSASPRGVSGLGSSDEAASSAVRLQLVEDAAAAAPPGASRPAPASRKRPRTAGKPPRRPPRPVVGVSPRVHLRRTSPPGDQLVAYYEVVRIEEAVVCTPCEPPEGLRDPSAPTPTHAEAPTPASAPALAGPGRTQNVGGGKRRVRKGRRPSARQVVKKLPRAEAVGDGKAARPRPRPAARKERTPWLHRMLAEHTVTVPEGLQCALCPTLTPSGQRRQAGLHVLLHLGGQPGRTCLVCGQLCATPATLHAHKTTEHGWRTSRRVREKATAVALKEACIEMSQGEEQ